MPLFWQRNSNKCKSCGSKLDLLLLPEFSGMEIRVTVMFSGLYVRSCPMGCTKKYPYSDFGSDLITAVHGGKELDYSAYFHQQDVRDMVIRKSPVCSYCGATADILQREPWTVSDELIFKDLAPFRVTIDLPVFTCGSCGVTQALDNEDKVVYLISEAIINAFDSIGLTP